MTVLPRSFRPRRTVENQRIPSGSSPLRGSSKTMRSASSTSMSAIINRCRFPIDRCLTRVLM